MAKKTSKAKWQDIYEVVGIKPGIIVNHQLGNIDLSNPDLPLVLIEKLANSGCSYLRLKVASDNSALTD